VRALHPFQFPSDGNAENQFKQAQEAVLTQENDYEELK
jgi:hypothetical protein